MSYLPNVTRIKLRHRLNRLLSGKKDGQLPSFAPPAGHVPAIDSDLERIFWGNNDLNFEKWLHHLPIYERHLAAYRGTGVRVLQIGAERGGSLAVWRKWLGPQATIVGTTADPDQADHDGEAGRVVIGNGSDPEFLAKVVEDMGGVDIVIDDGSHVQTDIHAAFNAVFPKLSEGGLYIVEDTYSSYWKPWGGGYGVTTTFMETVKTLIDDLHHWYHHFGAQVSSAAGLAGIHVYDAMVVLDKRTQPRPAVKRIGRAFGQTLPELLVQPSAQAAE